MKLDLFFFSNWAQRFLNLKRTIIAKTTIASLNFWKSGLKTAPKEPTKTSLRCQNWDQRFFHKRKNWTAMHQSFGVNRDEWPNDRDPYQVDGPYPTGDPTRTLLGLILIGTWIIYAQSASFGRRIGHQTRNWEWKFYKRK
jgi:hypothetical protein